MAGEYQFSLIDVTKQQGTKTILKDVNLSFFYGAHIGVIGGNGAGKSSLLKILAGLDTELMGTVQVAKGTKVGYLPQEPELDDSKTVLETVMEGVAVFEATHGTAPKYAGLDKVNPGSLILSGEMMLRYMGWTEAADRIVAAMDKVIAAKTVTYDFARQMEGAKEVKCSEFAAALAAAM